MKTTNAFGQKLPTSPPDGTQDRPCAKYDAARMIRQLRLRAGLNETQFAARIGMNVRDVFVTEIGEAGYQRTMDMRDRAQTLFGDAKGDPDIQPQAERRAASVAAAWIERLPD